MELIPQATYSTIASNSQTDIDIPLDWPNKVRIPTMFPKLIDIHDKTFSRNDGFNIFSTNGKWKLVGALLLELLESKTNKSKWFLFSLLHFLGDFFLMFMLNVQL